jgi:hypothetical protein
MTQVERINAAIQQRCEQIGYRFKPWQPTPWEVETPEPPAYAAAGSVWGSEWPRVWRLRQQMIAELGRGET